jgi:phosphatidylinositol-4,5-bisphosphate 3-kinase
MLIYGDAVIRDTLKRTEFCPFNYSARIMEWINFSVKISDLPKETRIGVNIFAVSANGHSFLIGCSCRALFDEFGVLRTGLQEMNIWPFYKVEERLACMQDFFAVQTDHYEKKVKGTLEYCRIYLQFDLFDNEEVCWSLKDFSYLNCMYKSLAEPYRNTTITIKSKSSLANYNISLIGSFGNDASAEDDKKLQEARPQIEQLAYLEKVLMTDPLEDLHAEDKKLLFICRNHYKTLPLALPLFLKSVDWTHPLQVQEAYKVLNVWSLMKPEDALALLNADYPDENVRLYAVRRVSQLSDEDLAMYSPQLIQALAFECCHFSVLSEMLLERSLKNPFQVGHAIYWGIRSQLHVKATAERFGLFLEQFVNFCGEYRKELFKELCMVKNLTNMGNILAEKPKYEQRREYLPTVIKQFVNHFNTPCILPINSTMEVKDFDGGKCRIMKSKKMPLFMSMRNSEIPSQFIQIIFKDGDDLRQDIVTLQMITVMDTIWLENGLDLRMKPYLVVATGDQSGMIEIVMNSKTTADIHNLHGKFGALKENTLRDYILEKNGESEEITEKAFDNFVRSCAGYCVATYVLGIGDRHNGNIMLTNNGHLFHIDFGHFLGNFKSKFGIKRERSGFVLTQEMAYVMDGKDGYRFQIFKDYCCKAFNYVRKQGKRLINLFLLMISAGMPELKNRDDIKYLREMLSMRLTEKEASSKFIAEIENALNNYFRSIDNAIHVWR